MPERGSHSRGDCNGDEVNPQRQGGGLVPSVRPHSCLS